MFSPIHVKLKYNSLTTKSKEIEYKVKFNLKSEKLNVLKRILVANRLATAKFHPV